MNRLSHTAGGIRGFTLLELLVVIVIIGLLAGYVAPRYFSQVGKSEVQVAKAQIESLEKALDLYRLDNRRYPTGRAGRFRRIPGTTPIPTASRAPSRTSASSPTAATASPAGAARTPTSRTSDALPPQGRERKA